MIKASCIAPAYNEAPRATLDNIWINLFQRPFRKAEVKNIRINDK